jgi:hypothetical protein
MHQFPLKKHHINKQMAHQFKNHVKYWQNNQQITVAILKFLAERGLVLCALMKFCSVPGILIVISQANFHQKVKYNYGPVASFTPCIKLFSKTPRAGSSEDRSSFKLLKMSCIPI